jgi:hypothetical protein
MEPATSYVGFSTTSGHVDAGADINDGWNGNEAEPAMMAYSSAAMPSSMDADLALAIALQVGPLL